LKGFGIHFKRSRDYVHSPDTHYLEKLADIVKALEASVPSDGRIIVVFCDQFSFYRQLICRRSSSGGKELDGLCSL
jgi:hypothetical protein